MPANNPAPRLAIAFGQSGSISDFDFMKTDVLTNGVCPAQPIAGAAVEGLNAKC